DPVLARSSKTGSIFLAELSADPNVPSFPDPNAENVNVFRSANDGETFDLPVNGAPGFVHGVDFQDKDWIAVDNHPGPGYGNVYLAWSDDSSNTLKQGILLTRSTDDGLTWGPDGGTHIQTP